MTKKQIRKLANQIIEFELIHRNPNSSKEEKALAESQIIQLSGMIGMMRNGLGIMTEIDALVQEGIERAEKNNNENEVISNDEGKQ